MGCCFPKINPPDISKAEPAYAPPPGQEGYGYSLLHPSGPQVEPNIYAVAFEDMTTISLFTIHEEEEQPKQI